MLKKVMAMICAAVMVVGMAVPAIADPSPTNAGKSTTINGQEIEAEDGKIIKVSSDTAIGNTTVGELFNALQSDNIAEALAALDIVVDGDTLNLLETIEIIKDSGFYVFTDKGKENTKLTGLNEFKYVIEFEKTDDNKLKLVVKEVSDGTAEVIDGLHFLGNDK